MAYAVPYYLDLTEWSVGTRRLTNCDFSNLENFAQPYSDNLISICLENIFIYFYVAKHLSKQA